MIWKTCTFVWHPIFVLNVEVSLNTNLKINRWSEIDIYQSATLFSYKYIPDADMTIDINVLSVSLNMFFNIKKTIGILGRVMVFLYKK